jgi:adenosylhomocysteine nucleosidase
VKILLICPLPPEFSACRSVFDLRAGKALTGLRTAEGPLAGARVVAIESGAGRARAAAATEAACLMCRPDVVLDTGSCAGLASESVVGEVQLATACFEYELAADGTPFRPEPLLELASALADVEPPERAALVRRAERIGAARGLALRIGVQACGTRAVRSPTTRGVLHTLLGAAAANWETAAVFGVAGQQGIPALSLRVVTDLGDEAAPQDFRRNIRERSRRLYGYVRDLAERGWLAGLMDSRAGTRRACS